MFEIPWKVQKTNLCPADKPWGVVPSQSPGSVRGCHMSRGSAIAQMQALNIKYKNGEISSEDWEAEMAWLQEQADHDVPDS